MVQVFQNLLSNSLRYRRPDVPPQIHVRAGRHDREWIFRVEDNGQGFQPEYANRAFGIFKRLHGSAIPGTGIGLAICKTVIERHGGRIWADAVPGEGAVFSFTLPAA